MKNLFSSKEYPAEKRFDIWRTAICEWYVMVDMINRTGSDNIGYIDEANFGSVRVTDAQAPTQHILRRPTHISKASTDSCFVAFSISGSQQLEQDGKHATIGPGKACLFSTTRPYELRNGEPARSVFLEFSMAQIKDRLGRQDCPNTAAINTRVGIGKIAATLCATMASEAAALSETSRVSLGDQMLSVLALALEDSEHDPSNSLLDASMRTLRLQQIKRYIAENLSDPLLNVNRIARANSLSVRSLQYLFNEAEMTVSDFIWTERLEYSKRALEFDVGLDRTVTDIAMSAGFNSLSHFSSAFRKRYGISPSDVRARRTRLLS